MAEEHHATARENQLVDFLAKLGRQSFEREVRRRIESDGFLAFVWPACDFDLFLRKLDSSDQADSNRSEYLDQGERLRRFHLDCMLKASLSVGVLTRTC